MAQAVQIRKQIPYGSRWGLLDSTEHTDSSQPASCVPLWPLAGPGDVALQPRLFWIPKWRSEGSRQRPQDWHLAPCHQSKLCAPSLPPGAHQASCTSSMLNFKPSKWKLSDLHFGIQNSLGCNATSPGPARGQRDTWEDGWEESVCSGESSRPQQEPSGVCFGIWTAWATELSLHAVKEVSRAPEATRE